MHPARRRRFLRLALVAVWALPAAALAIEPGDEMLGQPAPAWAFDRWLDGDSLSLEQVRGRAVLVRWWTDGCRYCRTTLPVIEKLRQRYPDDLVVIGAYHPKTPRPTGDKEIVRYARNLGFHGPIAVDPQWEMLGRYWLDGHPEHGWTSVTFLLDRGGRIRWVHPGGEYHPSDDSRHAACNRSMTELVQVLSEIVSEPAPKAVAPSEP
jgi:thiol-disulfide isomerase/thioredoxin